MTLTSRFVAKGTGADESNGWNSGANRSADTVAACSEAAESITIKAITIKASPELGADEVAAIVAEHADQSESLFDMVDEGVPSYVSAAPTNSRG